MSTINEVFFSHHYPVYPKFRACVWDTGRGTGTWTLSLEQLSEGWAGVLGRSGDIPSGARATLWTFHSPGLGGGDLLRGVKVSLGAVHLPVSPLATGWACFCWGAVGLGMPLTSVPTGCIRSRVPGGILTPFWETWARLISSLDCCCQKGIFSFSLTVFFSLSLLLSIIEHLEGYF